MKVYVLSYFNRGNNEVGDGCWGVFTSKQKAANAVNYWMHTFHETLLTAEERYPLVTFTTSKSLYIIEAMELDTIIEGEEMWDE